MTRSLSSSASLRLAVHVQHHPARARLLDTLLPALGECDVITDPDPDGKPSAIRTYLECLRRMPPWATHLLVVQDDCRPCIQFASKALAAVEERRADLVALFLAGAPHRSAQAARRAHRAGESWVLMEARDWTPTVALAWPRGHVAAFLDWIAVNAGVVRVGDDNVVGQWTTGASVQVWATVPSLVEHPDVEASLIGRRAGGGKNRMRVAAVPPTAL